MTRIEQPVEVNHEVTHVGVVHGLLGLRLPGSESGSVVGEHTDDVDLFEVLERDVFEIGQFAPDDEVEQLRLGTIWHDGFFPNEVPGKS